MGRRYFGGWWPENLPVQPSSSATSIPGVWHLSDVCMLLEDDYMQSEIDSSVAIYKHGRSGQYAGSISWPRSTFSVGNIADASLGCKAFVDFLASASAGVDFGYPFKFYWEKQAPGSSTWTPVANPLNLTTTRIRLARAAYSTTDGQSDGFRGFLANFRYSSAARYMTSNPDAPTITVPSVPAFDGNTIALIKFDTAAFPAGVNSTPTAPWTSLSPAPTFYSASFSTVANSSLPGTSWVANTSSGYFQLEHDTGFSRNTDDFCAEIYFRTIDGVNWSYSNDNYATLFDMRVGTSTTGPQNVEAIALVLNKQNQLTVLRGSSAVIISDVVVNSNTVDLTASWYHAILNQKDGVMRLYMRSVLSSTATLVGEAYAGDHVQRLRLRNLTTADHDTQYRVRVKYGALREGYSAPATLSVVQPNITWDGPKFTVSGPDVYHLVGPNALPPGGAFTVGVVVDGGAGFNENELDYRWEYAGVRLDGTAVEFDDAPELLAWETIAGRTTTQFSGNFFATSGEFGAIRAVAICGAIATVYSPVAFIQKQPT